jgi:hypothetical protein
MIKKTIKNKLFLFLLYTLDYHINIIWIADMDKEFKIISYSRAQLGKKFRELILSNMK